MNCAFILNKIKNIKFKDNKINGEINNIIEIFKNNNSSGRNSVKSDDDDNDGSQNGDGGWD